MKMQTPDLADENFKKLKELFPNAVTETKDENGNVVRSIDADVLRQEINTSVVEGPEERYQFTWPGKREAIRLAAAPIAASLRPCREESVDFDKTENVYIEGDNLDVLKLLRETYLGRIKMIYIDPPYNTGSDSFVYDDVFATTEEEFSAASGQKDEQGNLLFDMRVNNEANGRFHTDWLNMLYPRLRVAKDLLSDEGVILVNMDENEIDNLQKICAEIFGKDNDLGTIIWDKRNPKGDAKGISYQHEYILAYAKNKLIFTENCKMQRPKKNALGMIKKAKALFSKIGPDYSLENANEEFQLWLSKQPDFSGGERAYNRIDKNGKIYQSVSMGWPNKKKAPDDYFVPLLHPITGKPCPVPERGWRNPSSTMKQLLSTNQILFGPDETTQPRRKYLLEDNMYENIPSLLYYGGSDTDMLSRMKIPFETPKVVAICQEHIASFMKKDDIVLDFFSGSATIAHAVLQQNAIDGGTRKFILVQLPEKTEEDSEAYKAGFDNICEIGEERIRRAGKMIKDENPLATKNLDTGFRVFKLDSSNMKDVYYNPGKTEQKDLLGHVDNIKEDRTPEDLLFQVMLEFGIPLSSKIRKTAIAGKDVFNVEDNFLIACFDDAITNEIITAIAKEKPQYVVLRDSGFKTDSVAANFEQIFATYSPDTTRRVL